MTLKINNRTVAVQAGQTILEVARASGIRLPSLCYHPDLEVKANCRVCVVEIAGRAKLMTACSTEVEDGMEILTDSPRVKRARAVNLELILSEHTKKCAACLAFPDCELLRLERVYKVDSDRLAPRKSGRKTYRFAGAVEIDGEQCLDCDNCITACHHQGIDYLRLAGAGAAQEIVPVKDKEKSCIYCGQCAAHCPSASAQEQSAWPAVEKALQDKQKIVIAQFAPAVRVSLGEEFGLPYGTNCEGLIYTALKKLGFNNVIDINFGADITTMTEAEELMERLRAKKAVWPMFTSCCPAWVAYAEFYHPELLPHLTAARSPHIHSAGALKTYWAQKNRIDPRKITVVSIVPCTAKKYEATRSELSLNGRPLVDYVLTTRELAYLIKKQDIDFKKLTPSDGDKLFNRGSGAAAIYGASGGVMESALRSAAVFACRDATGAKNEKSFNQKNFDQKNSDKKGFSKTSLVCAERLEFKDVRGLTGFKEAIVDIAGRKLKVGVVNGIGNFRRVLPKLKKYHYIEVMACPGGCLGGGGQPIPTTDAIRKKRLEGLYDIDKGRAVRRAHENKAMVEYYDWAKKQDLSAKVLKTKFKKTHP
ncbi:MAG: [Fe-Fe] hydrogenase large subunit C-terminal domain-containing protein [bacterium]|nr:[Fe-Fe] hydrogenase large subunit C-terminal domain-containing protein [bacterium]